MIEDKLIHSQDPKHDLLQFITEWFELVLPFEVHKGFHFQIRIQKERFERLKTSKTNPIPPSHSFNALKSSHAN